MALCVIAVAFPSKAHEVRPAVGEVSFEDGRWQIAFLINLEALIAGVGPGHEDTDDSPVAAAYNDLRAMDAASLKAEWERFEPRFLEGLKIGEPDGDWPRETIALITPGVGDVEIARDSILTIGGVTPEGAEAMRFAWSPAFGAVVFRTVADENGEGYSVYLTGGEASDPVPVVDGSFASGIGGLWSEFTESGEGAPVVPVLILLIVCVLAAGIWMKRRR